MAPAGRNPHYTGAVTSAEVAYLFRHALLREAAYQLHLPAERAQLHGLALELLEGIVAGAPQLADPWAEELAAHAAGARGPGLDPSRAGDLQQREVAWLRRALAWLFGHARTDGALRVARALAGLAACPADARVNALRLGGEAAGMTGDLATAADLLGRAAHEAGTTTTEGRAALRALAGVQMRRQQPKEAQQALEACIEACRRFGDEPNLGRALGALGVLRMFGGGTDAGAAALGEALKIQQRLGEQAAVATSQANLANILVQQGRMDDAMQMFSQAEAAYRQAGMTYHLALLQANRAVLHQNFGQADLALADHEAAVEGIQRAGDRASEARMRSNHGLLLADQGRAAEGERQMRLALGLARETGDRQNEALALLHLGAQYADRPDLPQGLSLLADALALLQAQGDVRLQAVARINLAEHRLARGEIDLARQEAEQAVELAAQAQDPVWGALCRNFLGRLRLLLGDTAGALDSATQVQLELEALGANEHALAQAGALRLRALAVTGRTAEAEALLARIRQRASQTGASASLRIAGVRCEALLESVRTGRGHTAGHLPAELGPRLVDALAARGITHG